MGWWEQNEEGVSFAVAEDEPMYWGDEPADLIGQVIDKIDEAFQRQWNRPATNDELRAGLEFSVRVRHVGGVHRE